VYKTLNTYIIIKLLLLENVILQYIRSYVVGRYTIPSMALNMVFKNYIRRIEEILGVRLSKNNLSSIKTIFFKCFDINPENVRGIVFGILPKTLHYKNGKICITTGMQETKHTCEFRENMLQTLSKLINEDGVLVIRIPFVSTFDSNHNEKLSEAFDPVVRFILHRISFAKRKGTKLPIPILTLGKNSELAVHRALEISKHPLFVTLPSVHPTYMIFKNIKIVNYPESKDVLHRMKETEYGLFESSIVAFYNIKNKYYNYYMAFLI